VKKPFMSVYTKRNLGPLGDPGQWRQAFGTRIGSDLKSCQKAAGGYIESLAIELLDEVLLEAWKPTKVWDIGGGKGAL
jgi:hypothetical protein